MIIIPYRGIVQKEDPALKNKGDTAAHCEGCMLEDNCERTTQREQKLKASLISRLNRIEGQIRGIRGMVERDAYCDDILNQVAAANAALNSVSKLILESHLRGCLVKKIKNGEDEIVDELLETIGKLL
jgi:DNA-binding FrmR family transcriptional regulator